MFYVFVSGNFFLIVIFFFNGVCLWYSIERILICDLIILEFSKMERIILILLLSEEYNCIV